MSVVSRRRERVFVGLERFTKGVWRILRGQADWGQGRAPGLLNTRLEVEEGFISSSFSILFVCFVVIKFWVWECLPIFPSSLLAVTVGLFSAVTMFLQTIWLLNIDSALDLSFWLDSIIVQWKNCSKTISMQEVRSKTNFATQIFCPTEPWKRVGSQINF